MDSCKGQYKGCTLIKLKRPGQKGWTVVKSKCQKGCTVMKVNCQKGWMILKSNCQKRCTVTKGNCQKGWMVEKGKETVRKGGWLKRVTIRKGV